MNRLVITILLAFGCTDHVSSTNEPVLTGDSCAVYTTTTSCQSEADCAWLGTGCACPANDPSCTCSAGACVSIHGGSGSGSASAACACSNGGVCYEQIGGPAQSTTSGAQIECTLPASGDGDPCARIQGQGTCQDSTSVTGLCICDNGIR